MYSWRSWLKIETSKSLDSGLKSGDFKHSLRPLILKFTTAKYISLEKKAPEYFLRLFRIGSTDSLNQKGRPCDLNRALAIYSFLQIGFESASVTLSFLNCLRGRKEMGCSQSS